MNVRILAARVIAAGLVAAACGDSSKANPTTTPAPTQTSTPVLRATAEPATQVVVPFTPVEEVLTPPPDIDTSGWLTYRDDANGFELKYPPDATVGRDVGPPSFGAEGVGTLISLPINHRTTLEYKYLFVTASSESSVDCVPEEIAHAREQHREPYRVSSARTGRVVFWKWTFTSAGMMHGATTDQYMTERGGHCIELSGVIAGVSPDVYSTRPPTPTKEDYSIERLTAIVATFRWLN